MKLTNWASVALLGLSSACSAQTKPPPLSAEQRRALECVVRELPDWPTLASRDSLPLIVMDGEPIERMPRSPDCASPPKAEISGIRFIESGDAQKRWGARGAWGAYEFRSRRSGREP
jgi:hypothetical protein